MEIKIEKKPWRKPEVRKIELSAARREELFPHVTHKRESVKTP